MILTIAVYPDRQLIKTNQPEEFAPSGCFIYYNSINMP